MRFPLALMLVGGGALIAAAADTAAKPSATTVDAAERPIAYVDFCRDFKLFFQGSVRQSHLVRELVRQAFLITAREGCGLVTRDAWLGDAMPTGGDNEAWQISTQIKTRARHTSLEFFRRQSGKQGLPTRIALPDREEWDYQSLLETAEKLSRKEFLPILRQAHATRWNRPLDPDAKPSEEIEKGMVEMTFDAQFLAARRLHEAMHKQGESAWMLGALARAYANLGLLTEFHWHPAHKVFRARSLLYAQRSLVRTKEKAWPCFHRAYAFALAGLHDLALKDLAAGETAWESQGKPEAARPHWVDLLGPYCRFEWKKLDPDKAPPREIPLTWLLRYHAVEACGRKNATVETAIAALEELPDCYRIHDGLCQYAGVSVNHSATVAPLTRFGEVFYQRLEAMPELPRNVRTLLKRRHPADGGMLGALFGAQPEGPTAEFKVRPKLIAALVLASRPATADETKGKPSEPAAVDQPEPKAKPAAAPDTGEPSWAALGHLIREMTFVQVYRRAHFEREDLSVSPTDFLKVVEPLIAGHPYRAFIGTMAWDVEEKRKATEELGRVSPQDFDWQAWPLVQALDKERQKPWMDRHLDRDFLAGELRQFLEAFRWDGPAHQLLKASPYSPVARAELIERVWSRIRRKAETWERESADQPQVLCKLAYAYESDKRMDEAQRCAEAAVKVCADHDSLQVLANIYDARKMEDKWLATLERRLELPDYGLMHGSVNKQIAEHFMEKRQWQRAERYAEVAAGTGSQWGLERLAMCHEAQQRWRDAEKLYHAISERYRGGSLDWYFFCRRTGKGDLKEAEAFAREATRDPRAFTEEGIAPRYLAQYWLLTEQPKKAIQILDNDVAKSSNPYYGLMAAMIADQTKDAATRDRLLIHVVEQGPSYKKPDDFIPPQVVQLAQRIKDDLAQGGNADIDETWLDQLFSGARPLDDLRWQAALTYQLGTYCQQHGKTEEANRLFLRVMACPETSCSGRTMAGAKLLTQGIGPDAYRDALLNGPEDERPDKTKREKSPAK